MVARVRDLLLEVVDLNGELLSLVDLLVAGRPVVVEFWATWCAPCRKTLPTLLTLNRTHGDELIIIGLSVEDPVKDLGKVRDYTKREGVTFPIAFSPRELFQFMNSRSDVAVPKLFVFHRDGSLAAYLPRYSPFTSRKLKSAIRSALSRSERLATAE